MDNDNSSKPVTKFNSGRNKLERIASLKSLTHEYIADENYVQWLKCLQSIRSELVSKMLKEELDKSKAMIQKLSNHIRILSGKKSQKFDVTILIGLETKLSDLQDYLEVLEDKYQMGLTNLKEDNPMEDF